MLRCCFDCLGGTRPFASLLVLMTGLIPFHANVCGGGEINDLGGLVVHVGCGDGAETMELRWRVQATMVQPGPAVPSERRLTLTQGLDVDPQKIDAARQRFHQAGATGQLTAALFDGAHLPYVDNLVNHLVVRERFRLTDAEIHRVLAPGGVVWFARPNGGWQRQVKPWPEEIDDWTHYLQGPDNNAVAEDARVGPPRHMQWLAEPLWSRNHHILASLSAMVFSEGTLFAVIDEATAANKNVPGKWVLVARDAFSGVLRWKRPLASWAWHQWRFRSGPPQMPRLLVARDGRVFLPLGLGEPISVLDAATGEVLETYDHSQRAAADHSQRAAADTTDHAEEIIVTGDTLLALCGAPVAEQAVADARFKGEYRFPNHKSLVAVDIPTGTVRWSWHREDAHPMPETLAAAAGRAYIQMGQGVACFDLDTGKLLWSHAPDRWRAERRKVTFGQYTLVVADGVVLCKLDKNLIALAADDGRRLWQCEAGAGFHAPLDVFVINGVVWQGDHAGGSISPPPVRDFSHGRDLHTGEVVATNRVMVGLQTAGHHHRCYREKATERFILGGKRGIEMLDLAAAAHSRNNWVRGTCQYGVLPAGGLIYAPPHACGCYMEAKLRGLWALSATCEAASDPKRCPTAEERLRTGPAYEQISAEQVQAEEAWLQFRHDARRSGVASTRLPERLVPRWEASLPGPLTQPVSADGLVLVASSDAGIVHALDAATGKVRWQFVAGGPIDSPPTIHRRCALFGSADGHVYCLRLADGALGWQRLVAPAPVGTVACDRVESLWPVHGSVLVLDDPARGGGGQRAEGGGQTADHSQRAAADRPARGCSRLVYGSAGRSTWLDGGIRLFALDSETGEVVHQTTFRSEHPSRANRSLHPDPDGRIDFDQNVTDARTAQATDRSDAFSMAAGAVSDVLVSDGHDVFLHHVRFDRELNRQQQPARHLFSTSSLLDDAENHRSHWVLGSGDFSGLPVAYSWVVNNPGRWQPTIAVPTGVMMVFDEQTVWGVQRQGDANGRYRLFRRSVAPHGSDASMPDFRKVPREKSNAYQWQHPLSGRPLLDENVRVTAMLKSGDRLYLGTMPVTVPDDDPHAAYEGRLGGAIWVVDAADGQTIAELPPVPETIGGIPAAKDSTSDGAIDANAARPLPQPVAWDGMAAADGRLLVATTDGSLYCFAAADRQGEITLSEQGPTPP